MAAPARAPAAPKTATEFIRGIGPLAAISLVVGSMVGSGIFIVSADISRQVSNWGPGALLLVYFPLVFATADGNYFRATGHHVTGFGTRWLAITGGLFAVSGLVYLVRLRVRRARAPRPRAR